MMFLPQTRNAERDAVCRACDKKITKGSPMISWFSCRNQGMHIHLHEECAIKLGTMAVNAQTERGMNE